MPMADSEMVAFQINKHKSSINNNFRKSLSRDDYSSTFDSSTWEPGSAN